MYPLYFGADLDVDFFVNGGYSITALYQPSCL